MKLLLLIVPISVFLVACEQSDIRTQAANVIYNGCIRNGEAKKWCQCLKLDLQTGFSDGVAYSVVNNRPNSLFNLELQGARLRCQCRLYPEKMAAYGLPCNNIKQLKL